MIDIDVNDSVFTAVWCRWRAKPLHSIGPGPIPCPCPPDSPQKNTTQYLLEWHPRKYNRWLVHSFFSYIYIYININGSAFTTSNIPIRITALCRTCAEHKATQLEMETQCSRNRRTYRVPLNSVDLVMEWKPLAFAPWEPIQSWISYIKKMFCSCTMEIGEGNRVGL